MGFFAGLAAQPLGLVIAILTAIFAAPLLNAVLKLVVSIVAMRNATKGPERSATAVCILATICGTQPDPPPAIPADPGAPPASSPPQADSAAPTSTTPLG